VWVLLRQQSEILSCTAILFDRDCLISIFNNLRAFNNLTTDAEWVLERSSKTSGFIVRPIGNVDEEGLWIGEYRKNTITREERFYDEDVKTIRKIVEGCKDEEDVKKKLGIDILKEKLKSEIVQDFRYFWCPEEKGILKCPNVEVIRDSLRNESENSKGVIRCFEVVDAISKHNSCPYTNMYCPLKDPNEYNRVLSYIKLLKKYHRNDKIELGDWDSIHIKFDDSPGQIRTGVPSYLSNDQRLLPNSLYA